MRRIFKSTKRGFSQIELIVVIVIIVIITALVLPTFISIINASNEMLIP